MNSHTHIYCKCKECQDVVNFGQKWLLLLKDDPILKYLKSLDKKIKAKK
jgi:hypothetical protein